MGRIAIFVCKVILLCAMASPAMAVRWIEDHSGLLIGAKDIRVQGAVYDVRFVQDHCLSLFADCHEACEERLARGDWYPPFGGDCGQRPEAGFVFRTLASAVAASQALLDQVLVDGLSDYDSNPFRVKDCPPSEFAYFCFLMTPYAVDLESPAVRVAVAENYGDDPPGCNGLPFAGDRVVEGDFALHRLVGCKEGRTIFAKWHLADAPGTLSCLLLAGVMGALRRRPVVQKALGADTGSRPSSPASERRTGFAGSGFSD